MRGGGNRSFPTQSGFKLNVRRPRLPSKLPLVNRALTFVVHMFVSQPAGKHAETFPAQIKEN